MIGIGKKGDCQMASPSLSFAVIKLRRHLALPSLGFAVIKLLRKVSQ
jgi:hypothetical protein